MCLLLPPVFFDNAGRGSPLDHADEFHRSAVALDDLCLRQRIERIIAALDINVRFHFGDQSFGGRLAEQHDIVHRFECADDFCAVKLMIDRPRRSFDAPDRSIRIQPEYEAVAERTGLFQIRDMPRMQDVEASIGKYDFLSALAKDLAKGSNIRLID